MVLAETIQSQAALVMTLSLAALATITYGAEETMTLSKEALTTTP